MNTIRFSLVALSAMFILLSPLASRASDDPPQTCTSLSNTTTSVAATDGHVTQYDVAWDGFDPNPLMYTTIKTKAGCLVAQLSVHAGHILGPTAYGDVYAVYQVSVDNVPLIGHSTGCYNQQSKEFVNCILMNNDLDNGATGKRDGAYVGAHSYHLYRWVDAGYHRIQVKYAGCCNGYYNKIFPDQYSYGAYSGGILTLHYPSDQP